MLKEIIASFFLKKNQNYYFSRATSFFSMHNPVKNSAVYVRKFSRALLQKLENSSKIGLSAHSCAIMRK